MNTETRTEKWDVAARKRRGEYWGTLSEMMALADAEVAAAVAAVRADCDSELETLMGIIESLPRNEFGQDHYLAVEAAYRTVISEAHRMLDERTYEAGR